MNDEHLSEVAQWLRAFDQERWADHIELRIDADRHAVGDLDFVLNDPGNTLTPTSRRRLEGLQAALAGPRGDAS
ncbi:hypothetical protein [Paraburkholderia youngii]|uniref:hypothetical protein n=1 Tax=Paraburkholderia youngii TaxID=2782701 RepID=UPI003D22FAA5